MKTHNLSGKAHLRLPGTTKRYRSPPSVTTALVSCAGGVEPAAIPGIPPQVPGREQRTEAVQGCARGGTLKVRRCPCVVRGTIIEVFTIRQTFVMLCFVMSTLRKLPEGSADSPRRGRTACPSSFIIALSMHQSTTMVAINYKRRLLPCGAPLAELQNYGADFHSPGAEAPSVLHEVRFPLCIPWGLCSVALRSTKAVSYVHPG